MTGPLHGATIVDFSHFVCGPYATKLLGDYGADVIKIEPPSGDPIRNFGPFPGDEPHPEKSGSFAYLNTNKRSVVLDLETTAGRDAAMRLMERADVVVESFSPGTMERLGLGWPALQARNPVASMVSISNFGHDSPYRDYKGSELVLYGFGGEMYTMGIPSREPVKMFGTAALVESGGAAAAAAMGAFLGGKFQGVGNWVDFSIVDSHFVGADRRHAMIIAWEFAKRNGLRQGGQVVGMIGGTYPCGDGWVEFTGAAARLDRLADMLGNPEWFKDPKWNAPGSIYDPALTEEFSGHFYAWLSERTKREIWEEARRARVLCGPLFTVEELHEDPHWRDRDFWTEVTHPAMGTHEIPGRPFVMNKSPWEIRRPAPLLGQHTEEVLREAGLTDAEVRAAMATSAQTAGVRK